MEQENALPVGTQLGEYEILVVLGRGGFGLTCRAHDPHLNKGVALKEYLPGEFAIRTTRNVVVPNSDADAVDYQWWLLFFVEITTTDAVLEEKEELWTIIGCLGWTLEEMPADVQEHFHQMDLPETAPVEIVFERESGETFKKLEQLIDKLQPSLVIVDTLIQLVQIGDINDYARTARALQPLLALTRRSNAHVLCLHHARKSGGSHGAEGLGSQALSGTVDVILSLKREEHYRIISSTQRRGRPLEDSVLRLNEDTGLVELAGTKKAMDTALKGEEIIAFLEEQEEPVRMATIQAELKGQRKALNDTIRALVEQGKIGCAGSGKRGDPYLYFAVPEGPENAAVSAACREQQLSSDFKGLALEKKAVPLFPTSNGEQKEQKI